MVIFESTLKKDGGCDSLQLPFLGFKWRFEELCRLDVVGLFVWRHLGEDLAPPI